MPEISKDPILSPHELAAVLKLLLEDDCNPSLAMRLLNLHDAYERDQASSNPDGCHDL